eukprot:m.156335 g.156335  ORF g.156335 m.156335 type:complete len:117 (-) comp23617_c0_seq2:4640-4990(-)
MFSRAKKWMQRKPTLENSVQISNSLILLVPPQDGWESGSAPTTQRWLESIYAKHEQMNSLLFCSACCGLAEHPDFNALFDEVGIRTVYHSSSPNLIHLLLAPTHQAAYPCLGCLAR